MLYTFIVFCKQFVKKFNIVLLSAVVFSLSYFYLTDSL